MGLAALQVAKATACQVVATAGNPDKRAAVRARGASFVAGSRDTRFVDVLACQRGQAGPARHACVSTFSPFSIATTHGSPTAAVTHVP